MWDHITVGPYYRGRAMLHHEWAGSTGVISRPQRKLVWNRLRYISSSESEYRRRDPYPNPFPYSPKARNALMTPLVLGVSTRGGNHSPSARLQLICSFAYCVKIFFHYIFFVFFFNFSSIPYITNQTYFTDDDFSNWSSGIVSGLFA